MTVREWLHSRSPRPPIALTKRLDALVARDDAHSATNVPAALRAAGDRLLGDLLRQQDASRDSALDLLAADALMTYMMESAAEQVVTLGTHADAAMSRISTILDESSPAA